MFLRRSQPALSYCPNFYPAAKNVFTIVLEVKLSFFNRFKLIDVFFELRVHTILFKFRYNIFCQV
jgi:hypothetical protein